MAEIKDEQFEISEELQLFEKTRAKVNRDIFNQYKKDYLTISEAIEYLGGDSLPTDIPVEDNRVFIREISKYIAINQA